MTTLADIQRRVGVTADGQWGPNTAAAIWAALPRVESVNLTPSAKCAAFIKGFEQCRLKAYLPTANDVPTIGWGTTKGVKLGMVWTQAQADAAFAADLAEFGAKVAGMLGTAPTTQNQYDAMVSLAYNIGVTGFDGSTVRRQHNAGNYAAAADAFLLWNKQAGKVLNGLTRRRAAERTMYLGVGQ